MIPEMTELQRSYQVPGKAVTEYPIPHQATLQPLLTSVETHSNGNKKGGLIPYPVQTLQSNANNLVSPVLLQGETMSTGHMHRSQIVIEKSQKSFYHKLPLPRSVSTMGSGESRSSDARVMTLFEHYKDPNDDSILSEGIERLCQDLQLRPDEFKVLVLAWKLNAEQMCRFSRNEFALGLKHMKVDSIKGIQSRLPEIVSELERDNELYKDLYRFTFKFGLDVCTGQRILPAETAIVLWRLVFTICEPPILSRWLRYLEQHPHVRGIPKDTWHMFLNFCDTVGEDLSSYDDTEAWPSLFDDFVEFENDQMNQNISKNETIKISDWPRIEKKFICTYRSFAKQLYCLINFMHILWVYIGFIAVV